ncbi:MAG TPA: L-histidine N(alpha)-methyltransferase [Rhodanobacteraceae bacterium]|jgi:dimethylhistidine N-methyltransferase|nr:L-histidine N(alpha)-methyltransferase [Rhodanobacteraceae bacterium]
MNANNPAVRRIYLDDRRPKRDDILADALRGLSANPKRLPSKYFYDARGSELFERICEQPEYYPTRVELAIMHDHIDAIAAALGPDVRLVEYGSGAGVKTRLLLRHLESPVAYVPVEISRTAVSESVASLGSEFPRIEMLPVCADFTKPIALPRAARAPRQTVVYFPGSTLGNFDPEFALRLLKQMRSEARQGGGVLDGGVLIGVDLVKDKTVLEAAYNDAAGVTAAFTLNLLVRLNREIGADFDLDGFHHRARYNVLAGRIETHIVSNRDQDVHIDGRTFHFARGEAMLVEYSCKYTLESFARLATRAGFRVAEVWTDPARQFSVQWLICD